MRIKCSAYDHIAQWPGQILSPDLSTRTSARQPLGDRISKNVLIFYHESFSWFKAVIKRAFECHYMCLPECPILPPSIPHGFTQSRGHHKSLGFFKSKGYLEGSQYQFSCEKGYSLVGAENLVCTDAGIWNDSLPSCLRGTCIFTVNRNVQP